MKLIRHKDRIISRMALVMALSFLSIQYMAGKILIPLLLAALLSVFSNFYELIFGMLIVLSWFYLWTLVIMPTGRNRYWTGFVLGCLASAVAFPAWLYSQQTPYSIDILAWYVIPAGIFTSSTLVFIRWFYWGKETANSELSTK